MCLKICHRATDVPSVPFSPTGPSAMDAFLLLKRDIKVAQHRKRLTQGGKEKARSRRLSLCY